MPKLIIVKPGSEPVTHEITEDSATIGRGPENGIVVDDVGCSRRHCQLLRISSGFEVSDLKSRNGTKVNGVPRQRHVLSDGDTIEIGNVRMTFRDREGAEEEVVLEDFGKESELDMGEDGFLAYADKARKGDRVRLSEARTTFGRKENNTVVLKDAMVSTYHCEVTKEGGGFVLRDLGSTNGCVVNGEQVSEATLTHGDRIRLGKTVFVFVDPAVADYEQALASEEETESEWGMMRAQVDMARVRRSRRASLVWLLVFVVLLGGAAAVFALNPELPKKLLGGEESVIVVDVPGNLVPDFSFEEGELGWAVDEGQVGAATVIGGTARQGESSLQVIGPEKGCAAAIARSGTTVTVAAGRAYEISAWVRTETPGTAACAAVIWTVPDHENVLRYSLTPWATQGGADEGGWSEVRAVVVPPTEVTQAEMALIVAGPGSARFDDITLKPASGAPAKKGVDLTSGGFAVHVGDRGTITVTRTGRYLLWNGGLVALGADGEATSQALCFQADAVEESGNEISVRGRLRGPLGEDIPAKLTVKAEDDRVRIGYEADGTGPGVLALGLGFRVARDYLDEGATLSGDEGARAIRGETDAENIRKVVLGGRGSRLSLNSDDPFRLRITGGQAGLRMAALSPPGKEERTFELYTDFTGMLTEARGLLNTARGAKNSSQFGEAVMLFDRVVNEYPFDDRSREAATTERDKILADGQARLEKANRLYEESRDFYDEGDLVAAHDVASALADDFGDSALAEDAAVLAKKIRAALKDLRGGKQEVEAKRLEERARDFMVRDQKRLAEVFFTKIVTRYPETESAGRAKEALLELQGK